MRGARSKRAAGSLAALAALLVISSAQQTSKEPAFYGQNCTTTADCQFKDSQCDESLKVCQCQPHVPISNQHDKCGKAAIVNEDCDFNEQCQEVDYQTECMNGKCACKKDRLERTGADGIIVCIPTNGHHGDQCSTTDDCHFKYAICHEFQKTCQCHPDMPLTNYNDKCGKAASINESCTFNEQCEAGVFKTECRNERCSCKYEMVPKITADGGIVCSQVKFDEGPHRTLDPAMIGVLVGMALMFVIICVVLRLFSRARWRENRTIFNTPNPRLMNVSLLRDSKLLHSQDKSDRRGSRVSVRPPSRQASQQELRPHSPSPARPHQSHQLHRKPSGSRRGSRASSGHSATSLRSATLRSPTTPGPTSVTVEIRAPEA